MSKVSLPFWRNGEAFQPNIYPEDLADYDEHESRALTEKRHAVPVLLVQRDFVVKVLNQSFPDDKTVLKLTVPQIRLAFTEFWSKGLDWREADRPLEKVGASSAASSPPGSA